MDRRNVTYNTTRNYTSDSLNPLYLPIQVQRKYQKNSFKGIGIKTRIVSHIENIKV